MGAIEMNIDRIGDYKFSLCYDKGGHPEIPYIVFAYCYSKDEHLGIVKEFGHNINRIHYSNFVKKFARDEPYRNKINDRVKTIVS